MHPAIKTLLIYSAILIVSPLYIFFISKYLCDNYLVYTKSNSNIASAVAAVFTVHIVLAAYIYKAFQDDTSEQNKLNPLSSLFPSSPDQKPEKID
ncbi:unnamed protein product [Gordionus sp. m RMFG-2023]